MTQPGDALSRLVSRKSNLVHQNFSSLATLMDDITRTELKLANRYAAFAEALGAYGEEESAGIRKALNKYGSMLSNVQEERRKLARRSNSQVGDILRMFSNETKDLKAELNMREKLKHKQEIRRKNVDRLHSKEISSNRAINDAKLEYASAKAAVHESEKTLSRSIVQFEGRKLDCIRDLLHDFLEMQTIMACRTLELLSSGQRYIDRINPEIDLKESTDLEETIRRRGGKITQPTKGHLKMAKSSSTRNHRETQSTGSTSNGDDDNAERVRDSQDEEENSDTQNDFRDDKKFSQTKQGRSRKKVKGRQRKKQSQVISHNDELDNPSDVSELSMEQQFVPEIRHRTKK